MLSWSELQENARKFHLSAEQTESVKEFYMRADRTLFDRMLSLLPGEMPMEELEEKYSSGDDRQKFLFLLIASSWEKLEELYKSLGYPQSMLDDISYDLRLWADKTVSDRGYVGLSPRLFSWENFVLGGKILQFGRLQCEFPHSFGGKFSVIRRNGELVTVSSTEQQKGALLNYRDPVINLHIPAAGPLRRELCIDSLKRIAAFSKQFRPQYDYRAFVCYSWILDPVWTRWNPNSNLAEFQRLGHLFEIPGHDQTDEVVWRVFGARFRKEIPDELPENTSMQRFVKSTLKQGGTFREFGFYILRDELPALFSRSFP